MASTVTITHNSLTGRNASNAHSIESVTGLKSSLANLQTDVSNALTYCYESANARDVSVTSASIAVAEASHIASMVTKFKDLSSDLAESQDRVEELKLEIAELTMDMAESVETVKELESSARDAASKAVTASAGVQQVAQQIDVVKALASSLEDKVAMVEVHYNEVKEATASVKSIELEMRTLVEGMELTATAVADSANAASEAMYAAQQSSASAADSAALAAADRAAVTESANIVQAMRDEVTEAVEGIRTTVETAKKLEETLVPAAEAMEAHLLASQQAVVAASEYAALTEKRATEVSNLIAEARIQIDDATSAAVKAEVAASELSSAVGTAQAYAATATTAANEALSLQVSTKTYYDDVVSMASSIEASATSASEDAASAAESAALAEQYATGALHWRGQVDLYSELPAEAVEHDVYYVVEHSTSYVYADGSWQMMAPRGTTYVDSLPEDEEELEALTQSLSEGTIITVLDDETTS